MDYGMIGSIFTVVVFVSFIGIVFWTFNSRNKAGFEEAANLVFDDEAKPDKSIQTKETHKTTNTKQESAGNE